MFSDLKHPLAVIQSYDEDNGNETNISCNQSTKSFSGGGEFRSCSNYDYPFPEPLPTIVGIICIIVAVVGAIGNLLTLFAIPWAQSNKILGFNRTPLKYTEIFIVNLAFSDFLYCITNLPMYSHTYFNKGWTGADWTCKGFAAFRYMNAFAAWMALGMVAFSRCLSLCAPDLSKAVFMKKRNLMTIILIWIYGFLLVSPTTFGFYGTFGWDPTLGKCDFCLHSSDGKCDLIEASETMIHPRKIFLTIAFIVPLIMIVMSYFTIWRTAIKSSSSLKLNSILETRKQLQSRDMKMTWTLFGMCFCYIVFVAPIVLCTLLEVQGEGWRGNVNLVCFIVYWLQYTTNFVIYAARSEQYRKAYIQYIKTTVPWLFEWKGSSKRRPRIFIINSGLRRTRSSPTLTVSKGKSSIKLDVKVEYSLDLRLVLSDLIASFKMTPLL